MSDTDLRLKADVDTTGLQEKITAVEEAISDLEAAIESLNETEVSVSIEQVAGDDR